MSSGSKVARNALCPCGSGKKYKRCHGAFPLPDGDIDVSRPARPRATVLPPKPRSSTNTAIVVCLLLALATLIIYAKTGTYGYTAYDDDQYVYQNPWVQAGLTIPRAAWAFTTFYFSNWHPLTWISYMLDFTLFGLNPGAEHLVNVALHLGSTLLLFLALERMTRQPWRCAVVAAIFAVHPLHVESVVWIAERKDVLSTFFEMLAFLLYVRYAAKPGVKSYAWVVVAFGLSLLAKPMVVTFPFVLLLLDYWPLRRIEWPFDAVTVRRLFLEKVPLLAMAAVGCLLTFKAQHSFGAVLTFTQFPLHVRIANAAIAYLDYMEKALWPVNLAVLYIARVPTVSSVVIAVLILVAITVAACRWVKKRPYIAVGWFWYLGTLVPVIGLVQVGIQGMADRYTYVPMVGLSIALVWTIADFAENRAALRTALAAAAVLALVALTGAAYQQAGYWKTSRTLFEHTLAVTRGNFIIENNLGMVAASEGNSAEAVSLYQAALATAPDSAQPLANLGHEQLNSGQLDQAQRNLTKAVDLLPNLTRAQADLGLVLAERGDFEAARQHLERALSLAPGDAANESNLCYVLTHLGRPDEAIAHCNTALHISPGNPQAQFNLNNALAAEKHENQ